MQTKIFYQKLWNGNSRQKSTYIENIISYEKLFATEIVDLRKNVILKSSEDERRQSIFIFLTSIKELSKYKDETALNVMRTYNLLILHSYSFFDDVEIYFSCKESVKTFYKDLFQFYCKFLAIIMDKKDISKEIDLKIKSFITNSNIDDNIF